MSEIIEYETWNGLGNIFNLLDARGGRYPRFLSDRAAMTALCQLTAADGYIVLIDPPSGSEAYYEVVYYSARGVSGTILLCGNGSRCAVAYACSKGIVPESAHRRFPFLAGDGAHVGSYSGDDNKHYATISINNMAAIRDVSDVEYYANCGTAHLVRFIPRDTLAGRDVVTEGQQIVDKYAHIATGYDLLIDFVEDRGEDRDLYSRCFTPSLDREIHACGSGSACVAVCHAVHSGLTDGHRRMNVHWRDGPVIVSYKKTGGAFTDITLESGVKCDATGQYEYK